MKNWDDNIKRYRDFHGKFVGESIDSKLQKSLKSSELFDSLMIQLCSEEKERQNIRTKISNLLKEGYILSISVNFSLLTDRDVSSISIKKVADYLDLDFHSVASYFKNNKIKFETLKKSDNKLTLEITEIL